MTSLRFLRFVLALASICVGLSACSGNSGNGSSPGGGSTTTYYTVTLNLVGTTGTLSATSVAAGGTVTVSGVGLASGYQAPITATNCTLSGTSCTTGAINSNTTITLSAVVIPPTTYTVSATAGTGTTITPATTTVTAGQTATFTVGLLSGYQNLVAVGCTISGTTCTTGAINSNTTVSISATAIPPTTYTVTAVAGTGTTITPASTTVNAGATATFTVGLLSGYQNLVAVGCTISGATCTTGPINVNTTVSLSATAIPVNYNISGTLGVSGASVTCGTVSAVVTGSSYICPGLSNGTYTVTPTLTDYTFSPTSTPVVVNGANATANFTVEPGIDNVKTSLRAVYDADLLSTPICFQIQTHGSGFHVVVTRTDVENGESVTLNDSGNNCDATKGDGIFSGQLTMASVPSTPYFGGRIGVLMFGFALVSDTTKATLVSQGAQLRIANATLLKGVTKTTVSGAFTIASNALFYNVPYGTSNQDVAKAMYQVVKDNLDGIAISYSRSNKLTTNGNTEDSGSENWYFVRQPPVYGTGITSFFDNSSSYGSNGVLGGFIENDDGDAEWGAFNHEGGIHMLGCCFASNSVLPFNSMGLPHIDNGLFDFPDIPMGGSLYLVKQSDGDYVVTLAPNATLPPLVKYFDRLIPASAVPPMCAAFGYTTGTPFPGTIVPASAVTCFTIQDVIAQFGPVSLARTTSNFHVVPVVLYEDGQRNDALITSTNWMFQFYAGTTACSTGDVCSFSGMMKGDATLDTSVSLK